MANPRSLHKFPIECPPALRSDIFRELEYFMPAFPTVFALPQRGVTRHEILPARILRSDINCYGQGQIFAQSLLGLFLGKEPLKAIGRRLGQKWRYVGGRIGNDDPV